MTITEQFTRTGGTATVRSSDPASVAALAERLGLSVAFDDTDSPADAMHGLLLRDFVDGTRPWSFSKQLPRIRDDATMLPPGIRPIRFASNGGGETRLAVGPGWTIYGSRWSSGGGMIIVVADSEELGRAMLELAVDASAAPPEPEGDDRVEVGFWNMGSRGPQRRARPIAADPWSQIRDNYSPDAASALDRLFALDGADLRGRMLLVHGAPGTGKTTALRSLAAAWRQWCQLDFVVDPEQLFSQSAYLIEVVMGASDDDAKPWRMLLLEDCDELIRGGAKQSTGQALSRLLNLTDGILGQGRNVLVAITTNEDLGRLHPAVTRPGRCLAEIEVGPLPYAQAVRWLGTATGVPAGGATLAQLVALRDETAPVRTAEVEPTAGLYL